MTEAEALPDPEARVLVLAPTGRDAVNSLGVLAKAGIAAAACRDVPELCREVRAGVGAVLLTEEALVHGAASLLEEALAAQPSWSDLPILLLTRGGPESPVALGAMRSLGNVIALERPVRVSTLVSTVRAALRARDKQYLIRDQLDELRRADLRKDEFLATLAHELRNPLAPIRTGLHLLQREPGLSSVASRTRDMMDRQIVHMVRLIDDLMDLSRITRGKTDLRVERMDLRQALESAVEASRSLIDDAGHELTVALPDGPLPVLGDPTRLAQVLGNLLNNAAKYTPNGGHLSVTAQVEGAEVLVHVRDDGIGIPADMLHAVFDLFTQVGRSIERAQGGLGIGLTLVRRLVEMHGGSITVSSDGPGRGSTFSVRLPLAADAADGLSAPAAWPDGADAGQVLSRVLVVDDNVDAAETLSLLLESAGYETRTANDGVRALEVAVGFAPQVVFLDIGLPQLNGYEVARRLRGDPRHDRVVLVALTGWGSDADKQESRAAGFDFHLTKPAEAAHVAQILAEVAEQRTASDEPAVSR